MKPRAETNQAVRVLNRHIGEQTGLLSNGKPRFCWQWAPDMPIWRRILGAVWVMSSWTPPAMTELEWQRNFSDPYPREGMWHAMGETALGIGSEPTWHLTQNYIMAIQKQLSDFAKPGAIEKEQAATEQEVHQHHEDDWLGFRQMVQDESPAFNNFAPGKRGNHVSFGGS